MCVLGFPILLCATFFILSRSEWDMFKYLYIHRYVNYPLLLSDFNETWIFWIEFVKMLKYQISWKSVQWEPSCSTWTDGQINFMNIRPVGAELFHVDGRTDKFRENPSSGSRVVPCGRPDGRTDRHCEVNSRFLEILGTRLKRNHNESIATYPSLNRDWQIDLPYRRLYHLLHVNRSTVFVYSA